MNNHRQGTSVRSKEVRKRVTIAYVDLSMLVGRAKFVPETRNHPCRRGARAEESCAHVIVNAEHVVSETGKVPHGFRADQSTRASDERYGHWHAPVESPVFASTNTATHHR